MITDKKLEENFKSKIEEIVREFQYEQGFENRLNALKNLIIE